MRAIAIVVVAVIGRPVHAQPDERLGIKAELDAPDDVQLAEVVDADATTYVCSAPCTTYLRRDRQYIVLGRQISDAQPFALPAATDVRIHVDVGSPLVRALGDGFELLGVVAGGVAVVGVLGSALGSEQASAQAGARELALVSAGASVVLFLTGLELARHGRTTVELVPHVVLDARRAAITF